MIIDVLINSCARPDILDVSVKTFLKRIKSKYEFRYVILEDKVDDPIRQKEGFDWIKANEGLFSEIKYADKKLGPGFFFGPVVEMCKSDYFFHLEDDNDFIVNCDIDPIIECMIDNQNITEIILSRGVIGPNKTEEVVVGGINLTKFDLFSVATGLFNTKNVKRIIDVVGWGKQLHESGSLTPASKKLNLDKFILGHGEKHYRHVGIEKGYRKGGWKK